MSIVIERAKFGDAEKFFDLWIPFAVEMTRISGEARDSSKSIDLYRNLFAEYTSGRKRGVALFAMDGDEAVGVLLWGAMPDSQLDILDGANAFGWGAYTKPGYRRVGVSTALREHAIVELRSMGVSSVLGSVLLSNPGGVESSRAVGFKPTEIVGSLDLHEAADLIESEEDCGAGHVEGFYWVGQCPLCGRDEQ